MVLLYTSRFSHRVQIESELNSENALSGFDSEFLNLSFLAYNMGILIRYIRDCYYYIKHEIVLNEE